ncbi:hypothetical protein EH31_00080 [Erythrobacter longus]|uniref:Uncharacterized protein n=1 Tax=Erythrobacter longus TaxID=1044 RepID=A0A074MZR9_ERYLO|nr:hypothetical protein [Erythrobacter longus]KEO91097.1 hypothetical protein EH31_00080 [Erythrobacter longus]
MMIAMTITCLFVIAALATGLTLLDNWLQARAAFWSVFREQQLLDAGFVPQLEASEIRLRQPLHRSARRAPASRARQSGFGGAKRSNLGGVQAIG